MSFVVCGFFYFGNEPLRDRQTEIGTLLMRAALAQHLFIHLGLSVRALESAWDILEIPQGRLSGDRIPFSITESPLDIDADSLIVPFVNQEELLRQNVARVRGFLASVWTIPELDRVSVYISEGYDDIFDERHVELADFEVIAVKEILAASGPTSISGPSPKLVLTRPN